MGRMKLLVLFLVFAVAMLAFLAGAAAGGNDSTDGQEVVADIVDALSPTLATPNLEEAEAVYYDGVGTLVLTCFTVPASAVSERDATILMSYSYVSENNPEPNTIRLWRNTRSASSPIHRWIRA